MTSEHALGVGLVVPHKFHKSHLSAIALVANDEACCVVVVSCGTSDGTHTFL